MWAVPVQGQAGVEVTAGAGALKGPAGVRFHPERDRESPREDREHVYNLEGALA